MFMHNHNQRPKAGYYCPLMREICHEGWTQSMGVDKETGAKPVCNKWRSVFVNDPKATPPIQEVFDCVDGWQNDLLQQVAKEVYSGAVATEQARNYLAAQAGAVRRMALTALAVARKSGVTSEDVKQIEKEEIEAAKLLSPPTKPT